MPCTSQPACTSTTFSFQILHHKSMWPHLVYAIGPLQLRSHSVSYHLLAFSLTVEPALQRLALPCCSPSSPGLLHSSGSPPECLHISVYPFAAPMCSMRVSQLSMNDALFCTNPMQRLRLKCGLTSGLRQEKTNFFWSVYGEIFGCC